MSKKMHHALRVLGCVGIVVLVSYGACLKQRQDKEVAELREARLRLCEERRSDLGFALREYERAGDSDNDRARSVRAQMNAKIQHGHLQQRVLEQCLGSPTPVKTDVADACWIMKGSDAPCYRDVAARLAALYEERRLAGAW